MVQRNLLHEMFTIPVVTEQGEMNIFYFPLKKAAFMADAISSQQILDYVSTLNSTTSGSHPEETDAAKIINQILNIPDNKPPKNQRLDNNRTATIIPTEKCNLGCIYCYAHDSHCSSTLTEADIRCIIDYMFDKSNKYPPKFTMIGGGEPLVEWDLIKFAVLYAEKRNNGKHVDFGVATNLTLITPEIADFIAKHKISISASYDILPDIQNTQRPFADGTESYDAVNTSIHTLISHGVIPRIRSTIMEQSVECMSDMVEFVHTAYPEIKYIHLEHVSSNELKPDSGYYEKFVKHFFEARDKAKSYGIKLSNSLISSCNNVRDVFCGGELCFTPSRKIVSCHRMSGEDDAHHGVFQYGSFDGEIEISLEMKKTVQQAISKKLDRCDTCFAKYNCAGGCTYNKQTLTPEQFDAYCTFAKNMVKQYLLAKVLEGNKTS